MASTLRLPAGTSVRIVPSGSFIAQSCTAGSYQCRPFSQTSQNLAGRPMNFRQPTQSQPSFKSRTKGMPLSQLPSDLGLLPGTFVKPLWRDMPSIFRSPRERLHMEWTWLKTLFTNYGSLLQYCKKENDMPFHFKQRRHLASELMERMYTSFAQGNIPEIRRFCADGLATNLTRQIENRDSSEKLEWTLIKYLRQPSTNFLGLRVMSDRATSLPEIPNSGIRQIVVRVTSRQSTTTTKLQRVTRGAAPAETPVSTKELDCVEYIVVQNLRWNGKDKGWTLWGHTSPTTLHTAMTNPYFAPGLSAMERIEQMKEKMMNDAPPKK
ncbi:uncharacterized protein N7511_004131 [Penicillium nucicola]|uniref:uncharacterized protein n=1 Tax=Penicillium nucicola TaxID=1850975 RepID=UPI0025450DDC|nr:uncharacterized protein N7511_004131 [Penicillium nucicola]KAJ5766515.1 hypothetical protein N7511_004131 [Penicillium nucicola]